MIEKQFGVLTGGILIIVLIIIGTLFGVLGVDMLARGQKPVVPGTGKYVHTLIALQRPSGKILIDDEIIGPVDPLVDQSMDVALILSRKIPDSTRVCAETEMESKCVTLKDIRALAFKAK